MRGMTDDDGGAMQCSVVGCDKVVHQEGRVRRRTRRCGSCVRAEKVRRRQADPIRLLRSKFYDALRARGIRDAALSSGEVVAQVYARCQGRSVISGEDDHHKLCVAPYFRGGPLEPWNLVLMTTHEARRLASLAPADVHQDVPPHFHQQMLRMQTTV